MCGDLAGSRGWLPAVAVCAKRGGHCPKPRSSEGEGHFPPSSPQTAGAPDEAVTGRVAQLTVPGESVPRRAAAPAFHPSRGLTSPLAQCCHRAALERTHRRGEATPLQRLPQNRPWLTSEEEECCFSCFILVHS
jgi:hypothetical protein